MSARISVVTPTYQRAGTLPRLYESLLSQSFEEFEWVLVDDGSSDGTEELVSSWAQKAPFAIKYRWQQNMGKHAAVNRAVELAAGEFCALIDSDDWYKPEALRSMVGCWNSIPTELRGVFANVEGLRVDAEDRPLGDRFPTDVFDSNTFELRAIHGLKGDLIGMYRRDLLLAHPFPEDLGWHVSPSLVWNRIAATHSTRFVNQVWAYTDYREGGLSARDSELRLRFPEAQLTYWAEFAAMPRPMRRVERLRAHANCVRYSLLTEVGMRGCLAKSPARAWTLLATPVGVLLYLRDRRFARGEGGSVGGP